MPRVPAARPDGAKIRRLITERGFVSIPELARTRRRLKVKTIHNWCSGTQRGSIELLEELALALGVEVEDLIIPEETAALEKPRPAGGKAGGPERDSAHNYNSTVTRDSRMTTHSTPPDPPPHGRLTSTEVTYLLVQAKATGRLTVTDHGDRVRITGPEADRHRAQVVLFNAGLYVTPDVDHDDYARGPEAVQ